MIFTGRELSHQDSALYELVDKEVIGVRTAIHYWIPQLTNARYHDHSDTARSRQVSTAHLGVELFCQVQERRGRDKVP